MRSFPYEYLYIDEDGNCWYKTYMNKKEKCDINPYTLAGIPVIFNKNITLYTLIKLIKENNILHSFCFYPDEFYNEICKKPTEKIEGNICFYWSNFYHDEKNTISSSPKMEVDRVDLDNMRYGIELTSLNNLKNLTIKIDNTLKVTDNQDNVCNVIFVNPTLFEVIYGLSWEISFLGSPKIRNKKIKQIYSNMEDLDED